MERVLARKKQQKAGRSWSMAAPNSGLLTADWNSDQLSNSPTLGMVEGKLCFFQPPGKNEHSQKTCQERSGARKGPIKTRRRRPGWHPDGSAAAPLRRSLATTIRKLWMVTRTTLEPWWKSLVVVCICRGIIIGFLRWV